MLAPARLSDANDNVSEAAFDVRGLPVATALMGKVAGGVPETGDTVAELELRRAQPEPGRRRAFFEDAGARRGRRRATWLGKASARFVYHFGESIDAAATPTWGAAAPARAASCASGTR